MTEIAKKLGGKLYQFKSIKEFCLYCIVIYRVVEILVLGALAYWLATAKPDDKIVTGVGVGFGVLALAKLVRMGLKAERNK